MCSTSATSSILKPAKLTYTDHDYCSTGLNNTHWLEENFSPPPTKKPNVSTTEMVLDIQNNMDVYGDTSDNNPDNTNYQTVRDRKGKSSSARTQSSTQHPYKTVIKNKFEVLSSSSDANNSTSDKPSKRVPPIFLHDTNNHQALICDLNTILKEEYYTEIKGKVVKINVSCSDDYRALTAHLDSLNQKYHSFCPPEGKNLSVVIKNIPLSLTEEEITSELKNLNIPVLRVVRLLSKDKSPMPLCAVDVEDSDLGAEIFNLEFFFHCKVHVEMKRKPKSIPQCTRCQRFGHTKNYCKLDPRCVKCTGNHHFSQCQKKQNDPVQCVNCNEAHTANYRGCSYYIGLKSRIGKNRTDRKEAMPNTNFDATKTNFLPLNPELSHEQPQSNNSPKQSSSSKYSYANALKNNGKTMQENLKTTGESSSHEPSSEGASHSIVNTIVSLLKQYFPQIKTFLSELLSNILFNGGQP